MALAGEFKHTLDAKGRLFIPSKLRDELGSVFYVTISMEKCLYAYSLESWEALSAKVDAMPSVQQRRMRPVFANAAKCEADSQGRILLPQFLRDFADLKRDVAVIGCNKHAELWDAERWAEVSLKETTPENMAAVMEELNF